MSSYSEDNEYLEIQRQGGHYYITASAVYARESAESAKINFILDTGAFITVVSRIRAEEFGYDKLPKLFSKIKGFTGDAPADFVRIPCLKILNVTLMDVPVLIPHSKALPQNIIGLNVLEYFNYYVDANNSRIHLCLNPNPQHYHGILTCSSIVEGD